MAKFVTFLAFSGLISVTHGDQIVLLDTTKESMLDWTRYPFGPDAPTPGWVEESFTKFEKNINWRSYVVCDVTYAKNNVNNWLWTPFITRNGANRIHIEIKFSLRNCDLFPGKVLQCKETFSLLYYEFDAATREPPPWEPESYKLIDQIAADMGRFTDPTEVIINTETRSIEVTKKGVYFAFRDQGACLSILAVKVYYLACPAVNQGFAQFPQTPTGPEVTSILKISGKCVENAEVVDEPYNLCQGDGTWNFHSGHCACMAGYEADTTSQSCKACPVGRFKHSSGDGPCLICPPHSQALYTGSVECSCTDGYYRAPGDARTAACTRPPGSPQDLTYRWLDQTTLLLKWDTPSNEGGRSDTQYRVECPLCSAAVVTTPKSPSSQTSVTVSNLQPGATYKMRVLALNGVSGLSVANDNYAEIQAFSNADSQSAVVGDLRVIEVRPTQVRLMWRPPRDQLDVDAYEVRYFARGGSKNASSQVLITKKESITISGLRDRTNYGFEIRTQTASQGWGDFGPAVFVTTGDNPGGISNYRGVNPDDPIYVGEAEESGDKVQATVGIIISILVVLGIVGALAFFIRRNNSAWSKQNVASLGKDCDSLDYRGLDSHFNHDNMPIVPTHIAGQGAPPIYNPFSSHKTYVDPHTYEDPNLAVRQFAKEIDSKFITIEAIIGGGEFGDVCRGRLSVPDRNDMLVAIKTLKPGSTDKARSDFLTEASIMGQFEHPNVIFLQGVVTKSNPIMIITEFMENGSLDTFLRANDGKFQVMQMVGMMRGIAYGMQYLAEMSFVHRDLAARNVLVNSQLVCKIADFGLSREISAEGNALDGGAYTTRGGKIPVRWTAPEAIAFRKFTSASDVWSFGIVMWEVMSYGERPYWTWSNQDVIKAIEKGYRLPAPMDCPEAIHQLMLDCWQKERAHRPTFSSIVKTLDKLICCPETLKKIANSPVHNPFAANVPDYSAFVSVEQWLASIKMSRYADNFRANGYDNMEQHVAKMSLQQLVDIGVTLVGHQKKIMGSIHAMRAQLSVNMSEGFLV